MIRAYDSKYLKDAMECLGEMMDYAVNGCQLEMDEFMDRFIGSGYARQFELGVPKIVSGASGTEIAMDVLIETGENGGFPSVLVEYDYSPAFWSGWILAYYQWYTGRSFKEIRNIITMREIEKLYPTLHEASEDKFVDVLNQMIQRMEFPTKLQEQRKRCGYTQRELAEKVGISFRTLQQYEIRGKDINKAAGETLYALARVLGCGVEDLLEI